MKPLREISKYVAVSTLMLGSICVLAQDVVELQPYVGMKDQLEISLPVGWSVYDQGLLLTGKAAKTGLPIVFSAESIDGKAMMSGNKEMLQKTIDQLAGVEVGRIPGFMLDRLPAKAGMSCGGFDDASQKALLNLVRQDPMFGPGRAVREAPRAERVAIGGCQGLRIRGKGTASKGDGKNLDVFAVSDGEVVFFFKLLNLEEYYVKNVSTFETLVSSVKLTNSQRSGN